jgi:hypothetical protein
LRRLAPQISGWNDSDGEPLALVFAQEHGAGLEAWQTRTRRTLTPLILVRIHVPQPNLIFRRFGRLVRLKAGGGGGGFRKYVKGLAEGRDHFAHRSPETLSGAECSGCRPGAAVTVACLSEAGTQKRRSFLWHRILCDKQGARADQRSRCRGMRLNPRDHGRARHLPRRRSRSDGLALAPQAAPPCPALTAPAAPAARRSAVLRQPHTSYSLYAEHDVVEVLTKCRVQHLSHGDVRFVDARRY